MKRIHTAKAPAPIGSYSQAIQAGQTVYLSGQIALDPTSMQMVNQDIVAETKQVFANLQAVTEAAGGKLSQIVKLTVFLLDLSHITIVNEVMADFFGTEFPARSSIGVAALPKGAKVEVEAVLQVV